ncbi:prepilin-type N-terminal cleavage/methylation domain-containing protein [Aliagarivorans taiwanensis]|uniref:prepilin-type N-terminal cleavage/methylation domain-containing protein n=1 Tax=Aliagarivorans taiwanensis TaxID=561966 RepID=UPI0005572A20|nr:prepilin-type N-terminal cleavage/methylation domain-containing protein [Aliagarivorans taiwanensis]
MRNSGFSLIELLVVLSLMGLGAALVGPATLNQVARAEAQAELNRLKSSLRGMSHRAFTRSGEVAVQLYNNQLGYIDLVSGSEISRQSFEYIGFPHEQSVTFNRNGYPSPEQVSIVYRGRQQELNLFRLVEATDE